MPALDFCRGRRTLRAVEDDPECIAIYADNLKNGSLAMYDLCSFWVRHRPVQKIMVEYDRPTAFATAGVIRT